jgi:hypothetical protein
MRLFAEAYGIGAATARDLNPPAWW